MAILDNSGDIILDAVLTEVGRKRMATGNFRIVKFALGDDEINYKLYDKNHVSGSAYYDLEILQTPVFEAATQAANINYGLLSLPNPRLLYLPTMVLNTKVQNAARPHGGIFYLAVNDGGVTADALIAAFGGANGGGDLKVLKAGQTAGTAIMLETGLDTAEIPGTAANKTNYIQSQGLSTSDFAISVDTRFVTNVLGPRANDEWNNSGGSGESKINMQLQNNIPRSPDPSIRNHAVARVRAVNNNVLKRQNDKKADTSISAIKGPRASATAINFDTKILGDEDFNRYGKTGQTIAGAAGTYKYIDSVSACRGGNVVTQIPIRIIQKE
ncbi:hypothetical protein CMI37_01020 [Candidatus Pacearchaeota archaeon]|nr:hypothetical protein [Candidatus Pacearchaeota archaeon]|tara:strand:- start:342 stop:1325 length:984 start_codon:yes stop_codon:yes gene_type:complete